MRLILGDCLEKIKELEDNSVDSIVTDPPYHLTSIVKRFGKSNSAPAQFGTDGAFSRASKGFMGKEWDGGDIAQRPDIWIECLRVLKPGGHLLAFSGSRTYHRMAVAIEDAGFEIRDQIMWIYGSGFPKSHKVGEGIGTALKPAHEPIVMARKPISEKNIANNVLEWGTGGLNIDDSRIGDETGRWPANIMFDEEAGEILDQQSGISKTIPNYNYKHSNTETDSNTFTSRGTYIPREDKGGASRFFYCPKTSKKDREDMNNHPTVKPTELMLYLIKLVTPKGGTVLEPFMGSGSTGKAAIKGGFDFIGIERDEEYFNIAQTRINNMLVK